MPSLLAVKLIVSLGVPAVEVAPIGWALAPGRAAVWSTMRGKGADWVDRNQPWAWSVSAFASGSFRASLIVMEFPLVWRGFGLGGVLPKRLV